MKRAKGSPQQANDLACWIIEAAFGPNSRESFVNSNPPSSSSRTLQPCHVEDSTWSSEICPAAGTMRSGFISSLRTLADPTRAEEFSSLHGNNPVASLWPTVIVSDSRGSGSRNTATSKAHPGISLVDAMRNDGGKGRASPAQEPLSADWCECLMGFHHGYSRISSPQTMGLLPTHTSLRGQAGTSQTDAEESECSETPSSPKSDSLSDTSPPASTNDSWLNFPIDL